MCLSFSDCYNSRTIARYSIIHRVLLSIDTLHSVKHSVLPAGLYEIATSVRWESLQIKKAKKSAVNLAVISSYHETLTQVRVCMLLLKISEI